MVDMEVVISTLDALHWLRPVKPMGDWYQCYCPFHNNGNERKPSFGISIRDQVKAGSIYPAGLGHCFSCGYSKPLEAMIDDILKLHDVKQSGQEWLIQNIPGYEANPDFDYLVPEELMSAINAKYAVDYIQKLTQPAQKFISEEELASYRFVVPYMYERRLTDKVIEDYDIGYDANWIPPGRKKPVPCITIPIRDRDGHTLFFCRRSIEGKLYNYPQGVTKPVFGIDMIPPGTRSVIICESAINALTAVTYGYSAVALLGTGNSYQMQQLKELGVNEFVICMDGDDAGERATNKLKKALKSVAITWAIHMPPGKDLNDCDKATFDKLYSERD